ncbi:MAG: DUF3054 domain-containing protein [Chloroflexi bacterium]|nr:DUF3054 domain-containing protein [Chloroflexota bacterium]
MMAGVSDFCHKKGTGDMEHAQKTTAVGMKSEFPERFRNGFLWVLVAGDFAVFMLFAIIGRASHELPEDTFPLLAQFLTAAPFIAGWFAVSPFFGMYSAAKMSTWFQVLGWVVIAWLPAETIGLILRAIFGGRPFIFTFALVTFLTIGLMLLIWRILFWRLIFRQGATA